MTYNPINFNNGKAGGTPVSASNLRHVENGIVAAHNDIAALTANVNSLSERYGTPLVAHTAAEMTDNTKIYVYVGSETGYTTGNWYYYDGDSWESGGAYNSTAVNTDTTLTQEDMAADAKKVGDELSDLKSALSRIEGFDTITLSLINGSTYKNQADGGYGGSNKQLTPISSGTFKRSEPVNVSTNVITLYVPSDCTLFLYQCKTQEYDSGYDYDCISRTSYTEDTVVELNSQCTAIALAIKNTSSTGVPNVDNLSVSLADATYYSLVDAFNAINDNSNDIAKVQGQIGVEETYLKLFADGSDMAYVKAINTQTDEVFGDTTWRHTDYIAVGGYSKLTVLMPTFNTGNINTGVNFYDSEKNYLSGIKGNNTGHDSYEERDIDIPANASYARFSIRTAYVDYFYAKYDAIKTLTEDVDELIEDVDELKSNSNYYCPGMQVFEKIGVISDSISCGWSLDKNGGRSRRNIGISWVQQMARRLGCTAYNLGASGVDPIEWFQSDFEFAQYCYQYYQQTEACDLYIIGLGLNGGTLGTTADINQTDYTQNAESFYGQYARIIQMINHDHPNAIVMCLTEPTTRISSYDQAVRNICALSFINAELVDLENDYFDLFNTPEILAEHQTDGLHFTPYGYSLLAEAIVIALNDYIAKNPTHFKYVGVATV